MTQFKSLAIIFDQVDVTIGGKNIKDAMPVVSPGKTKKDEAKKGLNDFATYVTTLNSNVTMSLTIDDSPKTLRYLDLIKNGTLDSPFINPVNFEKAMKASMPGFSLSWGQYDTIFVIVPATGADKSGIGLTGQGWSVNGWGVYKPNEMKGAAIAFIPSNYNMEDFKGQVFIHEWLHGVCQFYKKMGWTDKISNKDSDEGGDLGYTKSTTTGDLDFYKDLMNAQLKNKKLSGSPLTGTPGVTNVLWQGGSMRSDVRNLVKNAAFKKAYSDAGGLSAAGYPNTNVQTWEESGQKAEIMYFYGPSGATVIMRLLSDSNAWFLPSAYWGKYIDKGKLGTLGAPISNVHTWSDGEIVDFKKADAKQCALMKPSFKNSGSIFYVPNEFWNKFVAVGGAPAVGYPQSDAHDWGSGQIIDFETKGGSPSGIMKANNSSNVYLVKGLIWKAYVATSGNGATSYLGHPTGDEFLWKDGLFGLFGTEYHRQNFQGGWCWASKTDVNKYGNDKNFNTNK